MSVSRFRRIAAVLWAELLLALPSRLVPVGLLASACRRADDEVSS